MYSSRRSRRLLTLLIFLLIIKMTTKLHTKLHTKLCIIVTFFNYTKSKRKVELMNEFKTRCKDLKSSELYIVELAYLGEHFEVTQANETKHLQLHYPSPIPLFHKENLINLAVKQLLPADAQFICWSDCDIQLLNKDWDSDAIDLLAANPSVPMIIQPWSSCYIQNERATLDYNEGFAYRLCEFEDSIGHPGHVWCCNRLAWDQMGGLYDKCIIGSGDQLLAESLANKAFVRDLKKSFKADLVQYQNRCKRIKVGYLEGSLISYYHGLLADRKYFERWDVLRKLDLEKHLQYTGSGVLTTTSEFPMGKQMIDYFIRRREG